MELRALTAELELELERKSQRSHQSSPVPDAPWELVDNGQWLPKEPRGSIHPPTVGGRGHCSPDSCDKEPEQDTDQDQVVEDFDCLAEQTESDRHHLQAGENLPLRPASEGVPLGETPVQEHLDRCRLQAWEDYQCEQALLYQAYQRPRSNVWRLSRRFRVGPCLHHRLLLAVDCQACRIPYWIDVMQGLLHHNAPPAGFQFLRLSACFDGNPVKLPYFLCSSKFWVLASKLSDWLDCMLVEQFQVAFSPEIRDWTVLNMAPRNLR
uniref:Uncharacterized protein n=1 Tax=Sphaerodactylus townsendi TaxID=933632 RepID=A0ACB8EZZ4_9SAUR